MAKYDKQLCKKYHNLEGILVAKSHVIKIKRKMCLMDLYDQGRLHTIYLEESLISSWYSKLIVGNHYYLNNLVAIVVQVPGCLPLPLLRVGPQSTIDSTTTSNTPSELPECQEINKGLVSYHGKITKVINRKLGIYETNNLNIIVLTSIIGVAIDLPAYIKSKKNNTILNSSFDDMFEDQDNNEETVIEETEVMFDVGDEVSLYNVHMDVQKESTIYICCGRSFVYNNRTSSRIVIENLVETEHCSVVACMADWKLGIKHVNWLTKLDQKIYRSLPDQIKEKVEDNGTLLSLVMGNFLNFRSHRRNVLLEFAAENHQCCVTENISKLDHHLKTLDEVIEKFTNEHGYKQTFEDSYSSFNYFTSEYENITVVGLLTSQPTLKFVSKFQSINVVITGKMNTSPYKQAVVAFTNFSVVEERIFINNLNLKKTFSTRYILVSAMNITSLTKIDHENFENTNPLTIDILSKSNLLFPVSNKKLCDPYFICKALVSEPNSVKKSQICLKIFEKDASMFSFIQDGSRIKGFIPNSSLLNDEMNKIYFDDIIKTHFNFFGTNNCIDLPKYFYITNISSLDNWKVLSVTDISKGQPTDTLYTVRGVVKERHFMSPRFNSEITNVIGSAGLPGNKLIRLLLCDEKNLNEQVSIYISCNTSYMVGQPPLCIIPGRLIQVNHLKLFNSQNNNFYLRSTILSSVIPVENGCKFLPTDEALYKGKSVLSRNFRCKNLSIGDLFSCTCNVVSILKLFIKCYCSCGCEIINRMCRNLSCPKKWIPSKKSRFITKSRNFFNFENERSISSDSKNESQFIDLNITSQGIKTFDSDKDEIQLKIYAEVYVGDGTGTGILLIDSTEHLPSLFGLESTVWLVLEKELTDNKLSFTYIHGQEPCNISLNNIIVIDYLNEICKNTTPKKSINILGKIVDIFAKYKEKIYCIKCIFMKGFKS